MRAAHASAALGPVALLALVLSAAAPAADAVPIQAQSVLLKKVLGFDRALTGRTVKLAVVFDSEPVGEANDAAAAFRAAGIDAFAIKASAFSARGDANVAFLFPSAVVSGVLDHCEKAKVLTVSRVVSFTTAGRASLAFATMPNQRTEIVVHMARAKAEGRDFSAAMLSLVRVVR